MRSVFLSLLFVACCVIHSWASDGEFQIFYKKGKAGIMYIQKPDRLNSYSAEKTILEPNYDSITFGGNFSKPFYRKNIYYDSTGHIFLLHKNGKTGLFRAARSKNEKESINCQLIPNPKKNADPAFVEEHLVDYSIALPCNYSMISYTSNGVFLIKENASWSLFDSYTTQRLANDVEYDKKNKGFAYAKQNGKLGLFDFEKATWILQPLYDSINKKEDKEYLSGFYFVYLNSTAGLYCINSYRKNEGWLIPINRYNKISYTTPKSTFLLVDSAGKTGVWQYEDEYIQKSWQVIAADDYSNLVYNKTENLIYLKKDNNNAVLSGAGWLTPPNQAKNTASTSVNATYYLHDKKVIVEYNKGIGFKVKCLTIPYPSSIDIVDIASYDSVYLKEYILYGIKNNKTTAHLLYFELWDKYTDTRYSTKNKDGLEILNSRLLITEADSIVKLPIKISYNKMIEFPQSLMYYKTGKWNCVKLVSESRRDGIRMAATKTNLMVDQWERNYESYYDQLSLFLVSVKGKWGVLNSDGKTFVPLVHSTFRLLDTTTLLFKSPVKDQWRYFSSNAVPAPEKFNPEWAALRVFVHNNEVRVDFTARKIKGENEIVIIDTKEYFLYKGFTNLPVIEWFTSLSSTNQGITGDVINTFTNGRFTYFMRKMPTGVGLYRDNITKIPPYLINIVNGGQYSNYPNYFTKLILVDKKFKSDFFMNPNQLEENFNLFDFIVQTDKTTCTECNGSGGENFTGTQTIKGETNYSTTKKTDYKDSYEKVWDMQTRSYKTVKTSTPKTRYETKTEKTADRKVSISGFSKCTQCKGHGYLTDAKFHCSISSAGLSVGSIVVSKVK